MTEHRELADTPLHIVAFGEGADGELYLLNYGGTIHRLVPTPPPDPNQPCRPSRAGSARRGCSAPTKDHGRRRA